jgi:hypothetical protein
VLKGKLYGNLIPHMGGVWERLVSSMKRLANVLLKEENLSDEALRTVACETECILNSRSLTASRDDIKDLHAITPASLLTLCSSTICFLYITNCFLYITNCYLYITNCFYTEQFVIYFY